MLYAYASPVDRATGLIGDLGISLYRGSNERIQRHVAHCWDVTRRIAHDAKVGMELRELYHTATAIISDQGLRNAIVSVTDADGTNIGHTIPWTDRPMTDDEASAVASGNVTRIAHAVSQARVFVNQSATTRISPGMAFTVEPRLSTGDLPAVGFHLIVGFDDDGRQEIVTEFAPLFERFDMELADV